MSTALHEVLHEAQFAERRTSRRSLWWRVVNALGLWRFLRVRRVGVCK